MQWHPFAHIPALDGRAVDAAAWYGMVWYDVVYVNLYSANVANVSNALGTLVPGKQPSLVSDVLVRARSLCNKVLCQLVNVVNHGALDVSLERASHFVVN